VNFHIGSPEHWDIDRPIIHYYKEGRKNESKEVFAQETNYRDLILNGNRKIFTGLIQNLDSDHTYKFWIEGFGDIYEFRTLPSSL